MPAPVFLEGVAHTQPRADRPVGIVREDPARAEDVEAGRQRPVEEPRVREADDALLGQGARAGAQRGLVAFAQEVALGEIDGADEAVGRGVSTADGEDALSLPRDLNTDDDIRLVRALE